MSQKRSSSNGGIKIPKKRSRLTNGNDVGLEADSQVEYNSEGEVGIIESISLKNFMCHQKLSLKLGSNVNFIVGRNGSGKSAILTAIVVGLGGKAQLTSRGHSMKDFIQNGKSNAEISVTLRNRGSDAHKPDLYGNAITVVRHLSTDGTNYYKLINSSGTVISQKRDDLLLILDQFNIQIDNPVSILNQEVSRNFLHSKSPHDKYKFFLKATQLEQMERDYRAADEQRRTAKVVIEKKEQVLGDLEKEVQEWRKKYRMHQSMDEIRKKIELLKNETAWAQVAELEQDLERAENELKEEKKKHRQHEKKSGDCKEALDAAKKHYLEIQDKLNVITTALQSLNPQHEEAKAKLNGEKTIHRNAVMEHRKILSEIKSIESDRDELRRKIEELRTSNKPDTQAKTEKRMQEIQEKQEEKTKKEAAYHSTQTHKENLKNSVQKYQQELYSLGDDEKEKKRQIDEKNRQIQDMEASRKDHLRRFGNWVPALNAKIEEAYARKRFVRKPRGPIGVHIKLKDPKWAVAVESCLRGLLTTYCCHNFEDERVLEDLMMKTINGARRPTIITSRFQEQLYDVRRYALRLDGFCSVLDALIIDDPVVANICIDQRGIESVLLVEDNKTAREIMSKRPPRNCQEAFTLVGDQIFPSPNYRYYSSNKTQASFLQNSIDDCIQTICEEKRILQDSLNDIIERKKACSVEYNKTHQLLKLDEIQIVKFRQDITRLQQKILELKNIDDPEQVDVSTLEDEVNALTKQLEDLQAKRQESQKIMNEKKSVVDELVKELQEVEDKIHSIANKKLEPLKDSLEDAENEVNSLNQKHKQYEAQKKKHEKELSSLEKTCEELRKTVESSQEKAERICEKVRTRRSPADIDKEITQYVQHLNTQEQHHSSKQKVVQAYYETKKRYDQILLDINTLNTFIENLNKVMDIRHAAYDNFRKLISVRVRYIFTMMLNQRNFTGKIIFDHDREQLNIHIQPAQGITEDTKDMKSLSGGERSYATVCFILALWDAMESPFRILDEFDVFMDMVTRRVSMDLMLETALSKTAHQFLFLTPQDMSALRVANDPTKVKIYRMPEPDRKQGRLQFSQRMDASDSE